MKQVLLGISSRNPRGPIAILRSPAFLWAARPFWIFYLLHHPPTSVFMFSLSSWGAWLRFRFLGICSTSALRRNMPMPNKHGQAFPPYFRVRRRENEGSDIRFGRCLGGQPSRASPCVEEGSRFRW